MRTCLVVAFAVLLLAGVAGVWVMTRPSPRPAYCDWRTPPSQPLVTAPPTSFETRPSTDRGPESICPGEAAMQDPEQASVRWRWGSVVLVSVLVVLGAFAFALANSPKSPHYMTPEEQASYIAYNRDGGPKPSLPADTQPMAVECNGN